MAETSPSAHAGMSKDVPPPELRRCFGLADLLEDELAGKILPDAERTTAPNETARLNALHAKLHAAQRSALCLSGGGIRSATFGLGVLQLLARHQLLPQFDYLSTVSGGGYIGGWLSAWIKNAGGIDKVVSGLNKALRVEPG